MGNIAKITSALSLWTFWHVAQSGTLSNSLTRTHIFKTLNECRIFHWSAATPETHESSTPSTISSLHKPSVCTHTTSTCFSCLLKNPIFLSYVPFSPGRLTHFFPALICAIIALALSINTQSHKPRRLHTQNCSTASKPFPPYPLSYPIRL